MSKPELVFAPEKRYLSLHGVYINQLGSQTDYRINNNYIRNRISRDGREDEQHITVINHLEIASLIASQNKDKDGNDVGVSKSQIRKLFKKKQRHIYYTIIKQYGLASVWERPIDLGMGRCSDGQSITYFRVIHWPFGQMIREKIGLPKTNFHITVGFSPRDVHLYKGPATLICLRKGEHCSQKQLQKLMDVVEYYFEDKLFIKALYKMCKRNRYEEKYYLKEIFSEWLV